MNGVDLVIIGIVGLVALIGLKSGIIKPVSGIGGFILGIFLAIQNYTLVAPMLAEYIENPMAQRIASFVVVVLVVAIVVRLIGYLVKKLLSVLVLGWLDHVAGMAGGAAVATAIVGTVFYVLGGMSFVSNNATFSESKIAPGIAKASLVTASAPWCSQVSGGVASGQPCTSIMGFAGDLTGIDFNQKLDDALAGQDIGTVANVVKSSFNGQSPSQIASLGKQAFDNKEELLDGVKLLNENKGLLEAASKLENPEQLIEAANGLEDPQELIDAAKALQNASFEAEQTK
jgi:membrane protein required for colicin V production